MSRTPPRTLTRWLVPVAVAAAVVGGAAATTAAAGRAPQVPDADVAEVLAAVAASDVTAYSGTVRSRSELGLPAIPGASTTSADAAGLALRLLGGDATVRVWVDGPTRQRLQLLDDLAGTDVVRNDRDVWTYSSSDAEVRHLVLAQPDADQPDAGQPDAAQPTDGPATPELPTALPTPAALAEQLLDAADPTTEVSLGTPQTVAGRATWTLLVTPRTEATLVAQAQVSVDTATGMPLRVQVVARGQEDAAVDVGFTELDLSTPPAERFDFTPPATASVLTTEQPARTGDPAPAPDGDRPTVLGEGWTTVLELAAGSAADTSLLDAVTTPVDGGRAVRTALVSALITDDGRVLVGAVPLGTLQALARS